jgi:hypothetical protein
VVSNINVGAQRETNDTGQQLTIFIPFFSIFCLSLQDNCGARTFIDGAGCPFGLVTAGDANDIDYSNATSQGATIRISTTACTSEATCPGTICGRITHPSSTSFSYLVTCSTPLTGTYLSIQLPGTGRILQLANVQINVDASSPTC